MAPYQAAALILIVVVAGGGLYLHDRLNRRRAEGLLGRRPQLDADEFGHAYFGESDRRAMLARELRVILTRHVPFNLDGLLPDDGLVQDLRMDALDSMSTVEFLLEVEERYGTKVPDTVAESLRTLRDLVDYLEPRVDLTEQESARGRPTRG